MVMVKIIIFGFKLFVTILYNHSNLIKYSKCITNKSLSNPSYYFSKLNKFDKFVRVNLSKLRKYVAKEK